MQILGQPSSKMASLFKVGEKVLEDFFTFSSENCFHKCEVNSLCIGQDIYLISSNVYRCILFTITDNFLANKEQAMTETLVSIDY